MKSILILLLVSVISACATKYTARDTTNAPILIIDYEGIIEDAIKLKLEEVYVLKYNRSRYYVPVRYSGETKLELHYDTLQSGKVVVTSLYYQSIPLTNIQER